MDQEDYLRGSQPQQRKYNTRVPQQETIKKRASADNRYNKPHNTDALVNNLVEAAPRPILRSRFVPRQASVPLDRSIPSHSRPTITPTQEMGGASLKLINHYRHKVLQQAQQSFLSALLTAIVGFFFFLAAVSFLLLRQPTSVSIISIISGSLIEVISSINFYLYGRASRQLASFHKYLDRTTRFLVSDATCEKIEDKELKDATRSKLILSFMEIPYAEFDFSKADISQKELSDND